MGVLKLTLGKSGRVRVREESQDPGCGDGIVGVVGHRGHCAREDRHFVLVRLAVRVCPSRSG